MMLANVVVYDTLEAQQAPGSSDLTFRGFRGEEDYAAMVAVLQGSKEADGRGHADTVEDVARAYRYLVNCDPYEDMRFVEVGGQVVGYSRVWWQVEPQGKWLYQHFTHLLPAWRGRGIRRRMLRNNERRLREIAADHAAEGPRMLEAWAADTEVHWQALLVREGYKAVRHHYHLIHPDLDEVPDLPLPPGLEVRPVQSEHLWTVWEAAREACQDQWATTEAQGAWFEAWQQSPTFDPRLWQVAWDGDEVAGMVLNSVDWEENSQYGRKRGYTEGICVRRPWRRQGLARALMTSSLALLREQGMTEAMLAVDARNSNGALGLYKSVGFRTARQYTIYQKPLQVE
jgi:ribosomal protein S18 acetylase RimI-like enzyme